MKNFENGIKELKLPENEYLYFWYANNKGRGSDNVTIVRSKSPIRATRSIKQEAVLAATKTSAWAGNVNFSRAVKRQLGV